MKNTKESPLSILSFLPICRVCDLRQIRRDENCDEEYEGFETKFQVRVDD